MRGITTIAALPSGAGQAAHLKAEVGEPRAEPGGITIGDFTLTKAQVDEIVRKSIVAAFRKMTLGGVRL